MGRKNNKAAAKKKEAAKAVAEEKQNEGEVKVSEVDQKSGNNANGQEDKLVAREVPEEDPATMTPAARAQNYFDEQMKVYNKFVTDFEPDIKMLNADPNFAGKFGGIEKFKKEGTRKNNQIERR
jgi:hypothetical protein